MVVGLLTMALYDMAGLTFSSFFIVLPLLVLCGGIFGGFDFWFNL